MSSRADKLAKANYCYNKKKLKKLVLEVFFWMKLFTQIFSSAG